MAESLISVVLEQLISVSAEEVAQQVKLVRGVDAEVEKLTSNLQAIKAVLQDAERRQEKEATVKLWVEKLKDVSYDIDDVLDEWNTALLKLQNSEDADKVCSFHTLSSVFCFHQVGLRYDIARKIKQLNERLAVIANEKNAYSFISGTGRGSEEPRLLTTSVIDVPEVFGREVDSNNIRNMLLSEGPTLRIISLLGMGGLGKTTLARLAFDDDQVQSHFDKRIWVCVSNLFDDKRIAKEILESLKGENTNLEGMDTILQKIREEVSGKKIFLVLDDVWTEDSTRWEPLKNSLLKSASPESRILITTRKERVAMVMGSGGTEVCHVGTLSEEDCWAFFSHLAFSERSSTGDRANLEDVGRKIVERCKGLPLAVKTMGSLLRFKKTKEEWQSIFDSEMWEIKEVEEAVFVPLLVSYYDLPSVLKQCFSYCAIFPEDYVITKDEVIKLWMAHGYLNQTQHKEMEMVGKEYFTELAIRSFFQDFEKDENGDIVKCKLHDLVHSFVRYLTKKECCLIKVDGMEKTRKVNIPLKSVRHPLLMMEDDASFPILVNNLEKTRSMLVPSKWRTSSKQNLLNSVHKLTCLRTLDLSCATGDSVESDIERLPKGIGKLIHLRYLNLSNNVGLETLPEAICELYNLQVLDISACMFLCILPHGIGKLKNLRHLENKHVINLKYMPKGLKRLTALRTLKEFTVGPKRFRGVLGDNMGDLGDLGDLRHLEGSLEIMGLNNVVEASEASEARLSTKAGLRELVLNFFVSNEEVEVRDGEKEAVVVEALQPPPCLQRLEIRFSNSSTSLFPSWMTSLTMLKTLEFDHCSKWESLPPLGSLPSLESLYIFSLEKVKKVGEEFLGVERGESSTNIIAFPNLQILELTRMDGLEDWEYGNQFSNNTSSSGGVTIMPRLEHLRIWRCPKLKTLPHHLFHHLQKLKIEDCPLLSSRFEEGEGEDWHYISHIPDIHIPQERKGYDWHGISHIPDLEDGEEEEDWSF